MRGDVMGADDGRGVALFAWRTGPVTARIDHVLAPDWEQRHETAQLTVVNNDQKEIERFALSVSRAAKHGVAG